jgi:hypothetical protein
MMKKEEQAVLMFERKIFRRIYGAKYEDREWKSRTNRELEDLSKGVNIVKWIKGQRISWLGHLERIEDRMPIKIFTQELEGTKRRGRPRKGWREGVENLQVLGVRRWRELVTDRAKWRDIVRQAKADSGLYCQWKKRKKKEEEKKKKKEEKKKIRRKKRRRRKRRRKMRRKRRRTRRRRKRTRKRGKRRRRGEKGEGEEEEEEWPSSNAESPDHT